MKITQLGVVGAGQMGAGIAQVAATAGYEVVLSDVSEKALAKGITQIQSSLERLQKKGQLAALEQEAILKRIHCSEDLKAHQKSQVVIEAIVENEVIKKSLLQKLDEILEKDALIASNTSSISLTRLAQCTKRPEQVIGMHFMNPVPLMQLVELIRAKQTSDKSYTIINALAESMGKVTTTSQDYPGFIANRILMPMINEAFYALMEGVASAQDIDVTMKLGTNQPMGPLTLADFIGLDTCLSIMQVLQEGFADSKYRPCPLLRQYVDAGFLGRKSGRGVYTY